MAWPGSSGVVGVDLEAGIVGASVGEKAAGGLDSAEIGCAGVITGSRDLVVVAGTSKL